MRTPSVLVPENCVSTLQCTQRVESGATGADAAIRFSSYLGTLLTSNVDTYAQHVC